MRKIVLITFFTLLTALFYMMPLKSVFAACPGFTTDPGPSNNIPKDVDVTLKVTNNFGKTNGYFYFEVEGLDAVSKLHSGFLSNSNSTLSFVIPKGTRATRSQDNAHPLTIYWSSNRLFGPTDQIMCQDSYKIATTISGNCNITIDPAIPSVRDQIKATVVNSSIYRLHAMYNPPSSTSYPVAGDIDVGRTHTYILDNKGEGSYTFWMENYAQGTTMGGIDRCKTTFEVTTEGGITTPENLANICKYSDPASKTKCETCVVSQGGAWTAIGCIPTDPAKFVQKFLSLGVGIAGGVAFLMILFGGFSIMMSAGNPEKLNAGKEILGSAIAGLLLIIFSVFILQLIGYNILGLPGFTP